MPSTADIERPPEALDVTKRYVRRKRLLNGLVAVIVALGALGAYRVSSLLPAVVFAVVSIIILAAPVVRAEETLRLRTDGDVESTVDDFTGPTPPVLTVQWGVSDEVTSDGSGTTYSFSDLYGLRSADLTLRTEAETTPDGGHLVESELTVDDQSWATYTSTISPANERTTVDIAYTSDRRLCLQQVLLKMLTNPCRDDVLAARGYTVAERDVAIGI